MNAPTTIRPDYVRPIDFKQGRVDMTHGSGGRASAQLVDELSHADFTGVYGIDETGRISG
jgi:hydrogenase expression/formation protein HypE